LRVRAEDEVDAAPGPPHLACPPVTSFEGLLLGGRRLPLQLRIEQVDKEIVAQRAGPLGEDADLGAAVVRAEDAQPSDEDRGLRRCEREQARTVDEQVLRGL